MIVRNFFKSKFGVISTASLTVLSTLLSSPQAQAMDEPVRDYTQPTKAVVLKQNQHDPEALTNCGIKLLDLDVRKAWLCFIAAGRHTPSLFQLGKLYENGKDGIQPSKAKALFYYKEAADQGNAEAQMAYATMKFKEEEHFMRPRQYPNESMIYFEKAATQGHPDALHFLGKLYLDGVDVYADSKTAVSYFEQAAEQGHTLSIPWLVALYQEDGPEPDQVKAAYYCKLLADQDIACFQVVFGRMCYEGKGVKQDYGQAAHYFNLAADQDEGEAYCYLGHLHRNGEGVKQDYKKAVDNYVLGHEKDSFDAFQFLRTMANAGDPYAQFELSKIWPSQEILYLQWAADQGHQGALRNLRERR